MSTLATVLSLVLMFTIPSAVWFAIGVPHGADDYFGIHMLAFLILGFLLFVPTLIALDGLAAELVHQGYAFADLGLTCPDEGGCAMSGPAMLAWIGLGVLVYWLSYIAGTSMRSVYNT